MSYTKGPWERKGERIYANEPASPGGRTVMDGQIVDDRFCLGQLKLFVRAPNEGGPEMYANERLILAAPELIEVAKELVRQVEEFDNWDEVDWPMAIEALRGHASAARAAIKKAQP